MRCNVQQHQILRTAIFDAVATVTPSEQKQNFRRTTSSAIVDSFSPGHDERYS
jgi:hypothetical protein